MKLDFFQKLHSLFILFNFLVFQIVCERADAFALGLAVSRAYPLFNRKTNSNGKQKKVVIEFLFVGENTVALDQNEVDLLNSSGQSVRLAAKIVDAPCSEMTTTDFVEVDYVVLIVMLTKPRN